MSIPPNTPHEWMKATPREEPDDEDRGRYAALTCRACGWNVATSDGYCLDCEPPDGFHDEDDWGDDG